mmetsp:Transcript_1392/g.2519  ORF Transcript_1392/g.2519 Transcript_1392/m.2519 type:complete len:132 (-) Transcript_1392:169-564(-)
MFLTHATHDGILATFATGITAHPAPRSMTQAFAPLDGDTGTTGCVALTPCRAVRRTEPGKFDGLVTVGELAEFALRAVGDTDPSLDDAVHAAGGGAFAPDSFGFGFVVGGAVGRGTGFSRHGYLPVMRSAE